MLNNNTCNCGVTGPALEISGIKTAVDGELIIY